ncbi:hypothetical protein QFZ36_000546 [Pseudarthrobacter siccitolerans]|uniref:Uncharacterized protein n=1 Tax=Pseudarthrobacter siccitolerans TaxID=861266 RepID=A0ABU0PG98_9MICC|nr:hypothetical protein [Pseudarthrobacter siccitolerans]MDQ0672985.1 hypothetical protein [Pseudarthrobacter siccitolerans]
MSNEQYDLGVQRQTNGLARQRSYPADIIPTTTAATYELNRAWTAQFRQHQAVNIASEGLDAIVEFDRKVEEAIMARPRVEQAALLIEATLMTNSAQILDRYMKGYS